MSYKKEDLMELILKKLKNYKLRKINLERKEFTEFINYLMNNN